MKAPAENLEKAAVAQQCRVLRLPAVADQCASLAEVAIKQRQTYLAYLEALLTAELEERERNTVIRRIRDARLAVGIDGNLKVQPFDGRNRVPCKVCFPQTGGALFAGSREGRPEAIPMQDGALDPPVYRAAESEKNRLFRSVFCHELTYCGQSEFEVPFGGVRGIRVHLRIS